MILCRITSLKTGSGIHKVVAVRNVFKLTGPKIREINLSFHLYNIQPFAMCKNTTTIVSKFLFVVTMDHPF